MSLKAFHIVFVTASVLMCIGVGAWGLVSYFGVEGGRTGDLILGVGSLVAGAALVIYGRVVLKKLRHISYL